AEISEGTLIEAAKVPTDDKGMALSPSARFEPHFLSSRLTEEKRLKESQTGPQSKLLNDALADLAKDHKGISTEARIRLLSQTAEQSTQTAHLYHHLTRTLKAKNNSQAHAEAVKMMQNGDLQRIQQTAEQFAPEYVNLVGNEMGGFSRLRREV